MLNRKDKKDEKTIVALKSQMKKESIMFDYEELKSIADLYFDFSMNIDTYYLHENEIVHKIVNKLGAINQ